MSPFNKSINFSDFSQSILVNYERKQNLRHTKSLDTVQIETGNERNPETEIGICQFLTETSAWYQVGQSRAEPDRLELPVNGYQYSKLNRKFASSNCSNVSQYNIVISNNNSTPKRLMTNNNSTEEYNCKHILVALSIGIATGLVSAIIYDLIKSIL
jgi:hypothetical protein